MSADEFRSSDRVQAILREFSAPTAAVHAGAVAGDLPGEVARRQSTSARRPRAALAGAVGAARGRFTATGVLVTAATATVMGAAATTLPTPSGSPPPSTPTITAPVVTESPAGGHRPAKRVPPRRTARSPTARSRSVQASPRLASTPDTTTPRASAGVPAPPPVVAPRSPSADRSSPASSFTSEFTP